MDAPRTSFAAQSARGPHLEGFKHGLEADLTRPFKFDKKLDTVTRVLPSQRKRTSTHSSPTKYVGSVTGHLWLFVYFGLSSFHPHP